MVGGETVSSKLKRAAMKMVHAACSSFSCTQPLVVVDPTPIHSSDFSLQISGSSAALSPRKGEHISDHAETTVTTTNKNICAICLDPLSYSNGSSSGQAIFTAQCSHAFHFSCISSNVRHGNTTCPICRAYWTQLPRNLNPPCSISCNQSDPVIRILDDSIASFRVHRRSFLRSARYDDDDPIEPDHTPEHPRIDLSLVPIAPAAFQGMASRHPRRVPEHFTSNGMVPYVCASSKAYLSVKLAHQRAIDLVLVASPNGPHLRLLKQSMSLVVFSLRPIDRLAIVSHSSSAARVFPLRRMTSEGKRAALQIIDRVFYMGHADPMEGLKKGVKILEDRAHKNPESCILHLSDTPTRSHLSVGTTFALPIHRFHVGFGIGTSNVFVMREFEEFLARILGRVVRGIQLRIGEEGRIIRIGELRRGEEKRMLLELGDNGDVCVGYSYVESGVEEVIRTGEAMVSFGDKRERSEIGSDGVEYGGRDGSSGETWDHHDPYMARRWAKHLHGYRF